MPETFGDIRRHLALTTQVAAERQQRLAELRLIGIYTIVLEKLNQTQAYQQLSLAASYSYPEGTFESLWECFLQIRNKHVAELRESRLAGLQIFRGFRVRRLPDYLKEKDAAIPHKLVQVTLPLEYEMFASQYVLHVPLTTSDHDYTFHAHRVYCALHATQSIHELPKELMAALGLGTLPPYIMPGIQMQFAIDPPEANLQGFVNIGVKMVPTTWGGYSPELVCHFRAPGQQRLKSSDPQVRTKIPDMNSQLGDLIVQLADLTLRQKTKKE